MVVRELQKHRSRFGGRAAHEEVTRGKEALEDCAVWRRGHVRSEVCVVLREPALDVAERRKLFECAHGLLCYPPFFTRPTPNSLTPKRTTMRKRTLASEPIAIAMFSVGLSDGGIVGGVGELVGTVGELVVGEAVVGAAVDILS